MSNSKITRENVAYQHINNGGIGFSIETDTEEFDGLEEKKVAVHHIEFSLSSFGIVQRCLVPVFETTPAVLRELADRLEAKGLKDPRYLSPKDAHIQRPDGSGERVIVRDGKTHRTQISAKLDQECSPSQCSTQSTP